MGVCVVCGWCGGPATFCGTKWSICFSGLAQHLLDASLTLVSPSVKTLITTPSPLIPPTGCCGNSRNNHYKGSTWYQTQGSTLITGLLVAQEMSLTCTASASGPLLLEQPADHLALTAWSISWEGSARLLGVLSVSDLGLFGGRQAYTRGVCPKVLDKLAVWNSEHISFSFFSNFIEI